MFGLLGPNGAGKASTVEILEGLRPRNAGHVAVLGFDPGRETKRLKDRIGVVSRRRTFPTASPFDANLLVVDGDPTRDISATERISMVVLKDERVRRVDLFDAAKNPLQ